jgi:hypothetical protein
VDDAPDMRGSAEELPYDEKPWKPSPLWFGSDQEVPFGKEFGASAKSPIPHSSSNSSALSLPIALAVDSS